MSDTDPAPESTNDAAASAPPRAHAWRDLHLWQIQGVRDVLMGLGVLGLFWLGQKLSVVTVPVLLAILFAYLFEPVIRYIMDRTRLKRHGSVTLVLVAAIGLIVIPATLGLAYGAVQSVGFATKVAENIAIIDENAAPGLDGEALAEAQNKVRESAGESWVWIRDKVAEARAENSNLEPLFDTVREWVQQNHSDLALTAAGVGVSAVEAAARFMSAAVGVSFMAFLTAFFFYFFATGWFEVKDFGKRLLPEKHEDRILELVSRFDQVISAFIRGRLTIAFLQSIVFTIGYLIIGVPAAFIIGPLVAILSIVPYLALVGVPISIILLSLEARTGIRGNILWIFGAPTAFYFFAQALDDYVWTPQIQGKETGMSTPMILFASLAGGALFGVFGLLIAIPIAACVKILVEEIFWPRFRAWADGDAADFIPIERD